MGLHREFFFPVFRICLFFGVFLLKLKQLELPFGCRSTKSPVIAYMN